MSKNIIGSRKDTNYELIYTKIKIIEKLLIVLNMFKDGNKVFTTKKLAFNNKKIYDH